MTNTVKNSNSEYMDIIITTKEIIRLAPGEIIEYEGDIELI
jgi:hypothetical protein